MIKRSRTTNSSSQKRKDVSTRFTNRSTRPSNRSGNHSALPSERSVEVERFVEVGTDTATSDQSFASVYPRFSIRRKHSRGRRCFRRRHQFIEQSALVAALSVLQAGQCF